MGRMQNWMHFNDPASDFKKTPGLHLQFWIKCIDLPAGLVHHALLTVILRVFRFRSND